MLLTKSFLLSSTEDISFTQNSHRGKQGKNMRGEVFSRDVNNSLQDPVRLLEHLSQTVAITSFTCLNGEAPFGCKNLLQFCVEYCSGAKADN